jgi:hypothetical protein
VLAGSMWTLAGSLLCWRVACGHSLWSLAGSLCSLAGSLWSLAGSLWSLG